MKLILICIHRLIDLINRVITLHTKHQTIFTSAYDIHELKFQHSPVTKNDTFQLWRMKYLVISCVKKQITESVMSFFGSDDLYDSMCRVSFASGLITVVINSWCVTAVFSIWYYVIRWAVLWLCVLLNLTVVFIVLRLRWQERKIRKKSASIVKVLSPCCRFPTVCMNKEAGRVWEWGERKGGSVGESGRVWYRATLRPYECPASLWKYFCWFCPSVKYCFSCFFLSVSLNKSSSFSLYIGLVMWFIGMYLFCHNLVINFA